MVIHNITFIVEPVSLMYSLV